MSGLDLIEDGFPHGTLTGYRLGCRHGACPAAMGENGGDSCRQANIRYHGDWEYRKAVEAGLPVPPPIREGKKRVKLDPAGRVEITPTITVASTERGAGRPDALTPEAIRDLVQKRADGATPAELALEYGLHKKTIYRYLQRARVAS